MEGARGCSSTVSPPSPNRPNTDPSARPANRRGHRSRDAASTASIPIDASARRSTAARNCILDWANPTSAYAGPLAGPLVGARHLVRHPCGTLRTAEPRHRRRGSRPSKPSSPSKQRAAQLHNPGLVAVSGALRCFDGRLGDEGEGGWRRWQANSQGRGLMEAGKAVEEVDEGSGRRHSRSLLECSVFWSW